MSKKRAQPQRDRIRAKYSYMKKTPVASIDDDIYQYLPLQPRSKAKIGYILFTLLALTVAVGVIATGVTLAATGVFSPVGMMMAAAGTAILAPKVMLAANIGFWCAAGVMLGLLTMGAGFGLVFTGKTVADYRSKNVKNMYVPPGRTVYSVSPQSSLTNLPTVESLNNILGGKWGDEDSDHKIDPTSAPTPSK